MNKTVKKVAILGAMEIEISYVETYLKGREGWKKLKDNIYANQQKKLQIITQVMGVGKVNAAYQTADIISQYQPDLLINIGYAGGLIQGAGKGDVAIGTEYVQVDFLPCLEKNRTETAESPKEFIAQLEVKAKELGITTFTGKIATGDFFLHSSTDKKRMIEEFAPIAFDMESAAVAQVAAKKQTEFIAVRTFSDLADDDAAETMCRLPIEQRPIILTIRTLEENQEW